MFFIDIESSWVFPRRKVEVRSSYQAQSNSILDNHNPKYGRPEHSTGWSRRSQNRRKIQIRYHMIYPLDLLKPNTYIKLNTKTQIIFCCVNENLTTFLYTLTGRTRKQKEKKKFSFLKCMQKSNLIEKNLGFSI